MLASCDMKTHTILEGCPSAPSITFGDNRNSEKWKMLGGMSTFMMSDLLDILGSFPTSMSSWMKYAMR